MTAAVVVVTGFAEARGGSEDHAASIGEAIAVAAAEADEIGGVVGVEGAGIEGVLAALELQCSDEVACMAEEEM